MDISFIRASLSLISLFCTSAVYFELIREQFDKGVSGLPAPYVPMATSAVCGYLAWWYAHSVLTFSYFDIHWLPFGLWLSGPLWVRLIVNPIYD